jgi:hypothetical protein
MTFRPGLPALVPVNASAAMRSRRGGLKDTRTLRTDHAKVTEHAPRGRDTSRNSLVPLGAGESPRSALSPAVSVPRYHAPTTGRGKRDLWHGKWSQATSNDRLGFLAVPRLWGLPDSPQAQAVGFPTHTHRYSESPYGSSPLGSLLRSVRPPGTDPEPNVEPSTGSNALDQHICPLTCASVATERVTRQTAALRCPDGLWVGLSRQLTERPHDSAPRVRVHPRQVDDVRPALAVPIAVTHPLARR